MKEARTYEPNSGSFSKGFTPWNKGLKGAGGRKDGAVKGKQGYQPKPVVALNADGKICRRFPSVAAAKVFFGLRDRHSITEACKQRFFCRGYRLMYEEDYIPWADYRNKRPRFRDIYGRLLKGHCNALFKKPSEEERMRRSERARELSKRLHSDPNSNFGKGSKPIPLICIETGERFPSFKDCSKKLGIPSSQISSAIKRHGTVHGYTLIEEAQNG